MPFSMERHDSLGYVVIRHHGHVEPPEIEEIYAALYPQQSDAALPAVIVDLRQCNTYMGKADLFSAIENLHHRHRVSRKTAFIADRTHLSEARFIELTAENRGFSVGVFAAIPEALNWLGIESS